MATIFEKIIAREVPAHFVYEDDKVVAFLDIRPNNKGHSLVVPKKISVNIFDADAETLGYMMHVAQKIAHVLQAIVGADGVNIIMNNGEAAGQEVPYSHIHVIPRFNDDDVFQPPTRTEYAEGEQTALAEQIKNALN